MMFNKNMIGWIQKIVNAIENSPTSFWLWLAAFSGIIVLRLLVENWLANFRNRSGSFIFYEFTHTFLFFLISCILFAVLINKVLKVEIKKVSNILLWGFLIVITPPIFDYIISKGEGFWSFYKFDSLAGLFQRFFTFFGDNPEIGITYGVRIEVAIALVFIFLYSLIKSQKSAIKSFGITLAAYIIFFILGTFPSYITILTEGFTKGFLKITDVDVARMFLTPAKIFSRDIPDIVSALNIKMSIVYSLVLAGIILAGLFFYQKNKLLVFAKNARFPQLMCHAGLVITGMGMAVVFSDADIKINFFNVVGFLVLLSAVFSAWLASIVPNDIYDEESDRLTPNKNRPLIQGVFALSEYKTAGWTLFAASVFFAAIVNFKIALFLIVYQAIAWIYSCPPLRLKRFAFISTFISSMAFLMILFSGFVLVSPDQSIKSLPFSIIALLVIGCTLAIPIKDFKDIEGDKKNGVWTIPVLFGEYWGKVAAGSGFFLSFILSVLILNEFRLFWWALLCGAISFWIILSSGQNKNIAYKRLPWWILGAVLLYGMISIKIVFA